MRSNDGKYASAFMIKEIATTFCEGLAMTDSANANKINRTVLFKRWLSWMRRHGVHYLY